MLVLDTLDPSRTTQGMLVLFSLAETDAPWQAALENSLVPLSQARRFVLNLGPFPFLLLPALH